MDKAGGVKIRIRNVIERTWISGHGENDDQRILIASFLMPEARVTIYKRCFCQNKIESG